MCKPAAAAAAAAADAEPAATGVAVKSDIVPCVRSGDIDRVDGSRVSTGGGTATEAPRPRPPLREPDGERVVPGEVPRLLSASIALVSRTSGGIGSNGDRA